MSPKNSRLRSVSGQTRQQSIPDPAAGSDSDRPIDALDGQEELAWMFLSLRSILHGLYCMAYFSEKQPEEGKTEEMQCLAELGEQFCTDASQRAYDLRNVFAQWAHRIRESEEEGGNHE